MLGLAPDAPGRAVIAEVRGQNPQGLHQRQHQNGHGNDGDYAHQGPFRAGQKQQRRKGKQGGEHRKQDRPRYPLGAGDGRFLATHAALSTLLIDAFTDDHRIVHHDAQHQNKGEQGNSIEGFAQYRQQGTGAQHAHRNPQRHPARQAQGEKHPQHQGQQHQPLQGIAPQQVGALTELGGVIAPHPQGHATGQLRLLQIAAHGPGHVQHVLVAHPVDIQGHRRLAVQPGSLTVPGETVLDMRHIPQPQQVALLRLADHQLLVGGGIPRLLAGLQQPITPVAAQQPSCDTLHALAGRSGHAFKRELVAVEIIPRHGQRHFPFRQVLDIHAGYRLMIEQLPAHIVSELIDILARQAAAEQQAHHPVTHDQLLHPGPLGVAGQGVQPFQAGTDLLQHGAGIMALEHIQLHRAQPLAGFADQLGAPFHIVDGGFHRRADHGFHAFRGGLGPGHVDADAIQRHVGQGFLAGVGDGHQPCQQQGDHQQVGYCAVTGEPGNTAIHRVVSVTERSASPLAGTRGSIRMPSSSCRSPASTTRDDAVTPSCR